MKISGVCLDSSYTVYDEELSYNVLLNICKAVYVYEVLPFDRPLSTLETFEDFAKFCLLPFI